MIKERVVIEGKVHLYRWVLFRCRWFQIVVHNFVRDDPPDLHDHAWWNVSIVLRGLLVETTLAPTPWGGEAYTSRYLRAGDVVLRKAGALHRLRVVNTAWTLFITGPGRRQWGYDVDGKWVPWQQYDVRTRSKVRTGAQ